MPQSRQHSADLLVVLLLFFVYAGCALMLCVLGANSYSHTVSVLQEGYDQRSGVLYIAQKVHQNDIGGGVRVDSYNGTDALVLIEQETGEGYETWIFIQDGHLCEELIASGSEIVPGQAQRIMPMQELKLTLVENLLSVSLTTDTGALNATRLALRSSGGAFNTGSTPPASSDTATEDESMSGPTIMIPPANAGGES